MVDFTNCGVGGTFLVGGTMKAKVLHEKCTLHSQRRILEYHLWKSKLDYSGGSIVKNGLKVGANFEMERQNSQ